MYDELVKHLRFCGKCNNAMECDYCEYYNTTEYVDRACSDRLMLQAADAIEELSAKATPKRVGFDGWKGYRNTRYKCPYCNKYVRNDETYCHKCGQALMFPHIDFTPYVPGAVQQVIVSWPDEPPKEE